MSMNMSRGSHAIASIIAGEAADRRPYDESTPTNPARSPTHGGFNALSRRINRAEYPDYERTVKKIEEVAVTVAISAPEIMPVQYDRPEHGARARVPSAWIRVFIAGRPAHGRAPPRQSARLTNAATPHIPSMPRTSHLLALTRRAA